MVPFIGVRTNRSDHVRSANHSKRSREPLEAFTPPEQGVDRTARSGVERELVSPDNMCTLSATSPQPSRPSRTIWRSFKVRLKPSHEPAPHTALAQAFGSLAKPPDCRARRAVEGDDGQPGGICDAKVLWFGAWLCLCVHVAWLEERRGQQLESSAMHAPCRDRSMQAGWQRLGDAGECLSRTSLRTGTALCSAVCSAMHGHGR